MAIDPQEIVLTDEQRRVVAELADRTGRSWPEVLADALDLYRPQTMAGDSATGGSFYDAMKEVIGIVQSAPVDLSTNPSYMEGFGRDHGAGAH